MQWDKLVSLCEYACVSLDEQSAKLNIAVIEVSRRMADTFALVEVCINIYFRVQVSLDDAVGLSIWVGRIRHFQGQDE